MTEAEYTPRDYYVYAHRKATTGEIFYIGKGSGDRAWQIDLKGKPRNKLWRSIVTKHGFVVEIVLDGLQEWAAFELERDLIALYGRRDRGLGSLANLTDGGEGASGQIQTEETKSQKNAAIRAARQSPEGKIKAGEAQKLAWADPTTRATRIAGLRKAHGSEVTKAKRKAAWLKPGARAKRSEQLKALWETPGFRENHIARTRQAVLCVETGIIYPSTVHAFSETGVHHTNISRVARKIPRYKTAGGFHWEYVTSLNP